MHERQACVAFNHLISQDDGEEALARTLGAALEARGLSLPQATLVGLVSLGPIFDVAQLREVKGIGPVRHRQLIDALAADAPGEDEDPMSPAIPEEVFEELELLELPEGDSDVHSEPPEGRAAPVIDLALYPRSPEDPAEGQPAARAPARPSADNLRERAEGVILRHVVFAVGTGLTPFPLLDLAALLALNVRMVVQLAELHEVDVHEHRVRVAVSSLLTTASVPALMLPVSSLLRAVPVIGTTFGALAMPSLASSLTYATGRVFARHFAEGGRVESMDLGQARDALRRAMKERAGP